MPDQSANLAALRASNHALRAYLSVYRGAEVFSATVDNTPADQAKTLVVTTVSGDSADVKAGYRVDVYSSGGDFKGRTRVRYAGTISATSLPIREHSAGIAKIVSGDVVRVYADVRLSDKLVSATLDFAPDDIAYSDQGSNAPPLACSGGAWAGWDDMTPIPFTGSASDYVDPDSNGPLSHAWSFSAGLTADDDDVADVNITAADAGEYLVAHTVTDDDNSKSTVQYVPLIVHDAANPPYAIVIEDVNGDEENGHSFSVRVFDDAALTDIPDGAFCVLWVEQWVNGTRQAFGAKSSGRSHILGVGYIRREEGSFDADSGVEGLRFEVISPMARLAELVGYSKVMTSEATPDSWDDVKSLSTERGIRQLWQFYSNATEAGFDLVTDASYVSYTYPQFFIQKSNPLAQMRELADGTDARLTCDRTGRFSLHTKPELLAVGSRAAATKTITLTTADIIDWQYTREHWRPVELLEARGFIGGTTATPIFSRWPGLAPGQGNQSVTAERLIAASQTNLNERCGRRGAAADGIYTDANGVLQTALDLELTLPGSYHVADFYDEYIAVSLTTALRGLDLSDHLFVLRSSRLELADDGSAQCVWTLRTATNGAAGVTYIPPSDPTSDYDFNLDFYLPSFSYETPGVSSLLTPPPGAIPLKMLLQAPDAGYLSRSTLFDFTTGTANFENIGADITGTPYDGAPDRFDYARRFVMSADGLWKCDDVWGGSAAFSVLASPTDIFGDANITRGRIQTSINKKGYIAVSSGDKFACSFDNGATWNVTDFVSYYTGISDHGVSSFVISQRNSSAANNGYLYLAYKAQGQRFGLPNDPVIWRLFKSTDWGLTWTLLPNLNYSNVFGNFQCYMHIPYTRPGGAANANDANQVLWWHFSEGDAGPATTSWMSINGGSTSAYSRAYGAGLSRPRIPVGAQASYTTDGGYGFMVVGNNTYTGIASTSDGWVSMLTGAGTSDADLQLISFPTTGNPTYQGVNGWGTSPDIVLWWGDNIVRWTTNRGADWAQVTAPHNVLIGEFDLSDWIPKT